MTLRSFLSVVLNSIEIVLVNLKLQCALQRLWFRSVCGDFECKRFLLIHHHVRSRFAASKEVFGIFWRVDRARHFDRANPAAPRAKRTRNWLRATRDSSANRTRRRRSVESGRLPRVREPSFWGRTTRRCQRSSPSVRSIVAFGDTHVIFRRRPHLRPRVRGGAPRALRSPAGA